MTLRRPSALFVLTLVVASSALAGQTPSLADTTILIIRHAEKPDAGNGLTQAGEARAKAYVNYFQTYNTGAHRFHVDYIFATADSKKSARPRLTVTPLANALHLKIDTNFKNDEYQQVADALKANHYGKDILIAWHHGKIPKLVEALGGKAERLIGAKKWPDDVYDWVIQLSYDKSGNLIENQTKRVSEHLMPTDKPGR